MDAERIAAGLGKAAVAAFRRAEPDGHLGNFFIRRWTTNGRTLRALVRNGLAIAVWSGVMLTEAGKAVRAIIVKEVKGES